jgi:hypothetical protein
MYTMAAIKRYGAVVGAPINAYVVASGINMLTFTQIHTQ